ncbi:cell wall-binding repeat-containing protein [Laceyella putida]|uniref:Cell wall-binding repeat-containing protein n=1 Tax=Laceyella putida TaxID=110101 RepID=A0ABW2RJE9_9BACL
MHKLFTISLSVVAALQLSVLPATAHATATVGTTQTQLSEADKLKTLHRIMGVKEHSKWQSEPKLSTRGITAQTVTTPVNYKGTASNTKQDEYVFRVSSPGTVRITANHTHAKIDYMLAGVDSSGSIQLYQSGDTLPAGEYSFVVMADSASALSYDYVISGVTFASQPDTTLPTIAFTSPSFPVSRLPQNTSSIIFSGNTNAQAEIFSNDDFYKSFTGDFNFTLPLHPGNNYVDLSAVAASGNATYYTLDLVVPTIKRLGGHDRFDVSANVAKEMPLSDTVIIASGGAGKFADALSGGSLAGLYQGPILLSSQSALPAPIVEEIKRRQPTTAVIMGGTDTIGTSVETQLKGLGVTNIKRMSGANRFAVAANAANHLTAELGAATSDTAIIANGLIFPDALSSSSLASDALVPTLLVTDSKVPVEIETFIKNHTKVRNFVIVGDEGSVSKAVADRLTALGGTVKRVVGADRYQVNLNLAKLYGMDLGHLVFAKGTDYPDALSGGPLAAFSAPVLSPLFLTPTTSLTTSLQSYLDANRSKIQVIYILGDEGSISASVANQLEQYVQ